jgi:hypothetical protein
MVFLGKESRYREIAISSEPWGAVILGDWAAS